MKITFSNLGAIKKTTLDLRPLTVIIGPNNSNKTYIAYSVYGLLQILSRTATVSFLNTLGFEDTDEKGFENINRLYELNEDGVYSLKINDNLFELFTDDCLGQTRSFEKDLEVFFQDSSRKIFKETSFEVKFTKNELKASLIKFTADKKAKSGNVYQFSLDKNVFRAESKKRIFVEKSFLARQTAMNLGLNFKKFLFFNPFLLPAERNALVITYKILEARRYDLLKDLDRKSVNQQALFSEEELNFSQRRNIRYPQPIEDFLKFLTHLEIEDGLEKGKFAKFADAIEKNLQQENKTNYISTDLGGKEIKINVKKGLDIDLYNASSSIKQLAPLLLYLRYRAKENDLLIIDEPEMNLHPESQAKLLEVLGMLVNAGVNVLLTTHSPYFMSHLNNLISGDMSDDATREKQAKSLYLEDARAFLKPEDVSAYEMRKGKTGNHQELHDLKDKDYGIRWDTLSDVSGVIQQKYFEIYEKGKQSSDGEEES